MEPEISLHDSINEEEEKSTEVHPKLRNPEFLLDCCTSLNSMYDPKLIAAAISRVIFEGQSVSAASRQFDVKRTSLRNYLMKIRSFSTSLSEEME